jgi:hypothetical protein
MQMSVSHSVLKRILIIYYEILIIKQEKREGKTPSLFFYILFSKMIGYGTIVIYFIIIL